MGHHRRRSHSSSSSSSSSEAREKHAHAHTAVPAPVQAAENRSSSSSSSSSSEEEKKTTKKKHGHGPAAVSAPAQGASQSSSSSSSSSSSDEEVKEKEKKEKKQEKEKKKHSHGSKATHDAPQGASSSSSSSSSEDDEKKEKEKEKEKEKKKKQKQKKHAPHAHEQAAVAPTTQGAQQEPAYGVAAAPGAPPASGARIPLSDATPFPMQRAGPPVAVDADGRTPVFVGSAALEGAVRPCKVVPTLQPPARVAWDGAERAHRGKYDLLPYDPDTMEWVPAQRGKVPHGRRPVEGGHEADGEKLFHALALVHGVAVPGETGARLRGANVLYGGEVCFVKKYDILVWRN